MKNESKKLSIFGHMVRLHDVTYNQSDDAGAVKRGTAQNEVIHEFYNDQLNGEEKVQARIIWNKHIDKTIAKQFRSQFHWGA